MKFTLLRFALLALCFCVPSLNAETLTLKELRDRYDKDGDGTLDSIEFAEALKDNHIRVVTPAGAKRAETARRIATKLVAEYPNLNVDLKHLKRAAQAEFLRHPPSAVSDRRAQLLNASRSDLELFDALTTYEKFLIHRAKSDWLTTSPNARLGIDKQQPDALKTFVEGNFHLRDQLEGITGEAVSDNPAKFAWTHSKGHEDHYTIDAALLLIPSWLNRQWDELETGHFTDKDVWKFGWRIRPAFEAHVSTQEQAARNEMKYTILFEGREKFFPGGESNVRTIALPQDQLPFISVHHFALAPVYVTDRVASVRSWGMDAMYEPSIPLLNLNHDNARPLFGLRWLEGAMKGGMGFAFREYDQGRPSAMHNDDYGLFTGHISVELTLFHRVKFSGQYHANSDLWGDMRSHDLFQANAEVLLDPQSYFTVGFTYICGESEPTFEKVDSFTAWVGVKF